MASASSRKRHTKAGITLRRLRRDFQRGGDRKIPSRSFSFLLGSLVPCSAMFFGRAVPLTDHRSSQQSGRWSSSRSLWQKPWASHQKGLCRSGLSSHFSMDFRVAPSFFSFSSLDSLRCSIRSRNSSKASPSFGLAGSEFRVDLRVGGYPLAGCYHPGCYQPVTPL
jgi:hypothetical protein